MNGNLRVRVDTPTVRVREGHLPSLLPPRILCLKWWEFRTDHLRVLRLLQALAPNQLLEGLDGEQIPIYRLALSDRDLWDINPNATV